MPINGRFLDMIGWAELLFKGEGGLLEKAIVELRMVFKSNRILGLAGLMFLMTFLPEMAWALDFFTPTADDISVNMLMKQIFGGALPSSVGGGGGADPMAGMFGVMNAGILSLGGVLAAYNLVVGTMQTAHQGEMLGKQWSSMWLPIRTGLGTALIVPFGKGYCVAQLLVMWLATQGVGLADKSWMAFVDTGFDGVMQQINHSGPKVGDLASKAVNIQVCMEALRRDAQENPNLFGSIQVMETPISSKTTLGKSIIGTKYGTSDNPDQCGRVERVYGSMSNPLDVGKASNAAQQAFGSASGFFGGFVAAAQAFGNNLVGDPIDPSALDQAHMQGYQNVMKMAQSVAQYAVEQARVDINKDTQQDVGKEAALKKQFSDTIRAYGDSIANIANNDAQAKNAAKMKEDAKQGGWMMAGSWFVKVARAMEDLNKEINRVFDATVNEPGESTKPLVDASKVIVDRITSRGSDSADANVDSGSSAGIGQWLAAQVSGVRISELKNNTSHPFIIADQLGSSLSTAGTTIMGLVLGFGIVGAVLTAGPFTGLKAAGGFVAGFASNMLTAVVAVLVLTGMYLQIYVPMMPFVFYFMASLAWMLTVVQAMIAAPIWAVMHLTGSGDDIMGGSRTGYTMLLSLTLRPLLLVCGFVAAVVVSYPFGVILNKIYFEVFMNSKDLDGGSLYNVAFMLMGTLIYCVILTGLLNQCLQLIHIIPNEVLQWFGGQGSRLGDSAEQTSQKITGGIKTAEGVAGAAAQGLAQQGSGLGRSIMDKNNEKEKNAQKTGDAMGNAGNIMSGLGETGQKIEASGSASELSNTATGMSGNIETLDGMMKQMGGSGNQGVSKETAQAFNKSAAENNMEPLFSRGAGGKYYQTQAGQEYVGQLQSARNAAQGLQSAAFAKADALKGEIKVAEGPSVAAQKGSGNINE